MGWSSKYTLEVVATILKMVGFHLEDDFYPYLK